MGSQMSSGGEDLDTILNTTLPPRPRPARPPQKPTGPPLSLRIKTWASSQVAVYRASLVVAYVSMMYFGGSAFIAGIPTFQFTTPDGWTPIWSAAVVVGGLIASIGSLRSGIEPVTSSIRIYNRIELAGAILLFLTLGTYATLLLYIGYGFGDTGRASIGSGFVALGVPPTLRMIWLIFRPRLLASVKNSPDTGPVVLIPNGYALVKVDPTTGAILPETIAENTARLSTDNAAHHNETASETADRLGLGGN